jgi:predicted permease
VTITTKFILFQVLIWLPLIAGSIISHKRPSVELSIERLVSFNLMTFEPVVVFWSIWGLSLAPDMIALPLTGVMTVLIGFLAGYIIVKALKFSGIQKHTFIISSSLVNHGFTMGGFLCYLFLGIEGLGLAMLFIVYFMPYLIMVVFSYARYVSEDPLQGFNIKSYILSKKNFPFYAVVLALLFQVFEIKRIQAPVPVDIFIAISVMIYYFALGTSFSPGNIRKFLPAHAVLAIIKFMIVPLIAIGVAFILPIGEKVRAVIIIQSFMPAAIYSVVTSILFKLDSRMASSLFVFNTVLFLFVVLPLLFTFRTLFIP